MKSNKYSLLAGVSAAALCLGLSAPAQAFNEVNWTWDAEVLETVEKNVEINIELEPSGMIMLEDLQVFIGDVTATSSVYGIYNNQPAEAGGTVDLGEQTFFWYYGVDGDIIADPNNSEEIVASDVQEACQNGPAVGCDGQVEVTVDLGEVEVPAEASLDALTELPEVISTATAVANNTSITSVDASVQLHEGQFVIGGPAEDGETSNGGAAGAAAQLGIALAEEGVNSNLIGAGVLGTLAILGGLEPAQISANSTVFDILNATVDSQATAVANNLTVDVQSDGDDRLVMGDVVQFAYADVLASSSVNNVSLNNYTNLGVLGRPIVNSIATAVGNNKSISVGTIAPVVE